MPTWRAGARTRSASRATSRTRSRRRSRRRTRRASRSARTSAAPAARAGGRPGDPARAGRRVALPRRDRAQPVDAPLDVDGVEVVLVVGAERDRPGDQEVLHLVVADRLAGAQRGGAQGPAAEVAVEVLAVQAVQLPVAHEVAAHHRAVGVVLVLDHRRHVVLGHGAGAQAVEALEVVEAEVRAGGAAVRDVVDLLVGVLADVAEGHVARHGVEREAPEVAEAERPYLRSGPG